MKLYHATYRSNLESIFENGLGAIQRKNWDISTVGGVCFADDMDLAISFCEAAENVDDDVFESGIVCLEIDSDALSEALLFLDPNFDDAWDSSACYLYRGIIAPADLKVCWEENIEDSKEVNNMIVDLILDRKDKAFDARVGLDEKSLNYNAHDFYMACMGYGRLADDITRAMDFGEEEHVKKALCQYIERQEYNPVISDYIQKLDWLNKSHWIVEQAAAKAFQAAFSVPVEDAKAVFNAVFDEALAFVSDEEKMVDFGVLSKDEFLASYSYLTEDEYDATARVVARGLGCAVVDFNELAEKLNNFYKDFDHYDYVDKLDGTEQDAIESLVGQLEDPDAVCEILDALVDIQENGELSDAQRLELGNLISNLSKVLVSLNSGKSFDTILMAAQERSSQADDNNHVACKESSNYGK